MHKIRTPYLVGFIIILVICIVGFVAWRIISSKQVRPADAHAVIKMLTDSYEPSELTVQKGQTVVFVNESQEWRWPASNLHPTHEIYAEFDPKEPVAPGDSWSFRFDKEGIWQMHDHLAPYITGAIHVTGQ